MSEGKISPRRHSPTLRQYLGNYVKNKSREKYGKEKRIHPEEIFQSKLNLFHHFLKDKVKDPYLIKLIDTKIKQLISLFDQTKQRWNVSIEKSEKMQNQLLRCQQKVESQKKAPQPSTRSKFPIKTSFGDYFQPNRVSALGIGIAQIRSKMKSDKKETKVFSEEQNSNPYLRNKNLLGTDSKNKKIIYSQEMILPNQQSGFDSSRSLVRSKKRRK